MHGIGPYSLFPVVWIIQKFLLVISYSREVLSEGQKIASRHLSDFRSFFKPTKWLYYQKYINQVTLNRITCGSHMHGLAIYVKKGLHFTCCSSWLDWLHSSKFLYRSPSSLNTVFDTVSSDIGQIFLINPCANAFAVVD